MCLILFICVVTRQASEQAGGHVSIEKGCGEDDFRPEVSNIMIQGMSTIFFLVLREVGVYN